MRRALGDLERVWRECSPAYVVAVANFVDAYVCARAAYASSCSHAKASQCGLDARAKYAAIPRTITLTTSLCAAKAIPARIGWEVSGGYVPMPPAYGHETRLARQANAHRGGDNLPTRDRLVLALCGRCRPAQLLIATAAEVV